ncbi:MAG: hypothetical protein QME21_18775, partial [Anaerolineales bacterium]|nr:hypothetical protein [Anaerolineales bacterium]
AKLTRNSLKMLSYGAKGRIHGNIYQILLEAPLQSANNKQQLPHKVVRQSYFCYCDGQLRAVATPLTKRLNGIK